MKCNVCGNNIKNEKYCPSCGAEIKNNPNRLVAIILLGIVVFIISTIIFTFSLVSNIFSKYEDGLFINIGQDKIPTFKMVDGNQKVQSVEENFVNGEKKITVRYKKDNITESDIEFYESIMLENDFYEVENNNYILFFVKESKSTGYVNEVYVSFTESKLEVIYTKTRASLEEYISEW